MPKKSDASKPAERRPEPKEEKSSEQDIQRKYIQLQMLRQYATAMSEEKAMLEARLNELMVTLNAVQSLKEAKKGEEIWSGLGSESFVMSDIKDTENIIVGIGAGVFVRAPRQRGLDILAERRVEMEKLNRQLAEELNGLGSQMMHLEGELQKEVAKARSKEE